MRLNPKEQEKLMLHMAGELAKQRRARGLKLNYVEETFPDGTKPVTVHNPIQ